MTTTRPVEAAQLKPARRAKTVVRRAKKNTKPAWIEQFVENYSFRDRHALASNPAIGEFPEIVEELSKDTAKTVRNALAQNRALSARTASPQPWQTQPTTEKAPSL